MPTRCTEIATCSCNRKNGPTAGKPDKPHRTSAPAPMALLKSPRSSKSPRPEYASEPPCHGLGAVGASGSLNRRIIPRGQARCYGIEDSDRGIGRPRPDAPAAPPFLSGRWWAVRGENYPRRIAETRSAGAADGGLMPVTHPAQ
jgi:hypothetical protein